MPYKTTGSLKHESPNEEKAEVRNPFSNDVMTRKADNKRNDNIDENADETISSEVAVTIHGDVQKDSNIDDNIYYTTSRQRTIAQRNRRKRGNSQNLPTTIQLSTTSRYHV